MPFTEQDVKQYFDAHAGTHWEQTKQRFLLEQAGALETTGAETLDNLVKARDIIDYKLYRDAVEALFPGYNLQKRINGNTAVNRFGHHYFKTQWIEFLVSPREADSNQVSCRIRINAPGSRTLTSDIDTSIMTWIKGESAVLFAGAHARVRDGGLDYEGRVTSAIIDTFYRGSEQEFKKTSSQHRDSNAYADLAEEEEQRGEYPKWREEINNPLIEGQQRLFTKELWQKTQAQLKQQKHRLELAASLFSLRVALKEEKWHAFTQQVEAHCDEIKDEFIEEAASQKAFDNLTKPDIKAVFAETQALWTHYEQALANAISLLEQGEDGYVSEQAGEDEVRNCKIAALNRLYVAYLEKRSAVTGQIKALLAQNQSIIEDLKPLAAELKQAEGALAHLNAMPPEVRQYMQAQIQQLETTCAALGTRHQAHITTLQKNHEKLNALTLEKLTLRYQAHTFAHEAYVCRSAVYHVVGGQSGQQGLVFSEQTLLSSALQQIGFKLLHRQELKEVLSPLAGNDAALLESRIAYKTAKYSQRLHQLLFNTAPITDDDISKTLRSRLEITSVY